jgi:hypothetical protein
LSNSEYLSKQENKDLKKEIQALKMVTIQQQVRIYQLLGVYDAKDLVFIDDNVLKGAFLLRDIVIKKL